MRYVGGKQRIAKVIAAEILAVDEEIDTYVEPFVGGGAVAAVLGREFDHVHYSDTHPDLILMWEALSNGETFPETISREEYAELRSSPPSALRGLVGFGGSFGGKWFAGYAKGGFNSKGPRNHYGESLRRAERDIVGMRGRVSTRFSRRSYEDVHGAPGTLIYADPPYEGTLGYGSEFDHGHFWDTVARWAVEGSHVFVSEYAAPDWIDQILEVPIRVSTMTTDQGRPIVAERLFHVEPL